MTHTITNSNIIYQCLIIPKLVIVFSTQIQTIHAYYFQYYLYESKLSIFNDIRITSMSIGKVHPPGSRAWTLNYSAVWVFSQRAYFIKLLWRHELFPNLKWNSSIRSIAKDLGKWLDSWRIYLRSSTRAEVSQKMEYCYHIFGWATPVCSKATTPSCGRFFIFPHWRLNDSCLFYSIAISMVWVLTS